MKKNIFIISISLFCLFSCSNLNNLTFETDKQNNNFRKERDEAELYISNMFIWDNIKMGRSITSKQKWPNFLSDLSMEDVNGNLMSFDDLTEEEKEIFFKIWYETEVKLLESVLETDDELLEYVTSENDKMQYAKDECFRTVDSTTQGDEFTKLYFKLCEKQAETATNNMVVRSIQNDDENDTDNSDDDKPDENDKSQLQAGDLSSASVNQLINAYKRGYVLISDKASSSGSSFGGHAAIMHRKEWDENWTNKPLAKISVSAWGDAAPRWKGKKKNKVQKEPLVYWAGTGKGCPTKVTIVRMRRKRWVWNGFKSGIRFYDASETDARKAVNNAINWIGRDYDTFALVTGIAGTILTPITAPTTYTTAMISKNSEKRFYCSKLVWRAWYKVSSEFDINPTKPVILPDDFREGISGGVTVTVASYKNKKENE